MKYKKQGIYILIATLLIVLLADQISSGLMKPLFSRLRPCHDPELSGQIRSLLDCGGLYGFVSSHAANHFGLAVIFSWVVRTLRDLPIITWLIYLWAGTISMAQIYVAKHYPLDVVFGAFLGLLVGFGITSLLRRWLNHRGILS